MLEKLLRLLSSKKNSFDSFSYVEDALKTFSDQMKTSSLDEVLEEATDTIAPFLIDEGIVDDADKVKEALKSLWKDDVVPVVKLDRIATIDREDLELATEIQQISLEKTEKSKKSRGKSPKTKSRSPSPKTPKGVEDSKQMELLKLVDPYLNNDSISKIQATTQVSRFYIESVRDSYDTTDVDLPGFSVTMGSRDLIVNARLKLSPGVAYGIVGVNGVGKSTMLKAIGLNLVVGWPSNVSVLYVEQELVGSDTMNCLESVLAANVEVTQWETDVKKLEQALHESGQTKEHEQAQIIHDLKMERAIREYREAWAIAEKRSGARGSEARKVLLEKEAALMTLKDKGPAKTSKEHAADVTWAQAELQNLYDKLSLVDADERKAKALRILAGLGFDKQKIEAPTSRLSGGWRMRLALARALAVDVDVLCLDEPSNHLDLPATLWLIHFLKERQGEQTLLLVSHDRNLLNQVAEEIILIKDKQLKYYPGNFDEFMALREEEALRKKNQQEMLDRKEKEIKDQIQRNIALAKKTGDDKRLGQAASRKAKFRNFGLNKTEDGKRYKESYHGFRQEVVHESKDKEIVFDFPEPDELRTLGPILQLRNISYKYGPSMPTVIDGVTLDVERGSRIGIVGANGAGKTTLLKLIDGLLKPTSGSIEKDGRLKVGYFTQQHVESLDLSLTPLQLITRDFQFEKEQAAWDYLGNFGVAGKLAQQPIATLSGGQRARLVLAMCLFPRPHVILFDEPTNHLDIQSIEALTDAMDEFPGGIVVVSHDIRFLEESCDEFYSLKKGKLERLEYDGPEGDVIALRNFVESMTKRVAKRGLK